ncbi:type VII secretion-associated protein [Rhodococcus zopfii]|uniref:type VII secretion-associated protein n=1 Tax=Rhodococcus zopfii TaxID=43772 RepID=UPI0009328EC0|nr:type VII secretion-associated protein [Rhodococcus zopfii]
MSTSDTLGLLLAPDRVFARWGEITLDCPAVAADIGDGFVFAEAAARRPAETRIDVVARIGDRSRAGTGGPELSAALTGLVQYAAAAVSAPPDAGTATMVYPTRWSERRREIAHTAARNVARNATLVAAAVAARQVVTASAVERCVAVEVADDGITASLLGPAPASGTAPVVTRTAVDGELGAADLESTDGFARFEDLIGSVAGPVDPDVLAVTGAPGEPSGGALCELIGERLGRGIRVVPVAASEMLTAVTAPPAAAVSVSTVPATAQWLSDMRTAAPPPPATRRWWVLAAVAVAVAVAAGVLLGRGAGTVAPPGADPVAEGADGPVPAAASTSPRSPSTRFALGPVHIELPEQWRLRGTVGQRSELVPVGGADRRIVVVHSRLGDGVDEAGVAAVLERRAAERGGVVRDVDADTTFGDRSVIAYTEVPEEFSTVRWFVVVDRGWQVAVGCQFLVGEWSGIGKECEQAVHTLVVR